MLLGPAPCCTFRGRLSGSSQKGLGTLEHCSWGDKRDNSDFIYFLAGKHFAESGNDSFCRPHRCYNSCKYGRWSSFIPLWFLFQDSIIFIFQQFQYAFAESHISLLMFLYFWEKKKKKEKKKQPAVLWKPLFYTVCSTHSP